jgi:hypothetical protein
LNDGKIPKPYLDEVGDIPECNAVNQVANRTAQYQRQSRCKHRVPLIANAPQPDRDGQAHATGKHYEKPALPAPGVSEKTEGRSRIALMGKIDE